MRNSNMRDAGNGQVYVDSVVIATAAWSRTGDGSDVDDNVVASGVCARESCKDTVWDGWPGMRYLTKDGSR